MYAVCVMQHCGMHVFLGNRTVESRFYDPGFPCLVRTHLLFKWCRRLKAVDLLFIAVYWLRVLDNLKFYLYVYTLAGEI